MRAAAALLVLALAAAASAAALLVLALVAWVRAALLLLPLLLKRCFLPSCHSSLENTECTPLELPTGATSAGGAGAGCGGKASWPLIARTAQKL